MHPSDRSYRNQTVRIADLTVISDTIENVTFENCTIEGPAVLHLANGTMMRSGMEGHLDAIVWVIPDDRTEVIGAVALVNCTIVGCQLRRIGLLVPESGADRMRRELTGG